MPRTPFLLAPIVLALLAAAPPAPAQGGGFQPGELVLYTPMLHGSGSASPGLVRIDPTNGQVTPLIDLSVLPTTSVGGAAYDAYRDRVVFNGAFPTTSDPLKLWAIDASGTTTDLGLPSASYWNLTPGGGGRIYCQVSDPSAPLRYLDASNVLHTLMDVGGTQPFKPPQTNVATMVYEPGTNALFAAVPSYSLWSCGGGTSTQVTVHRLPLSLDGSRVAGPIDCVTVPVDPSGNNVPVGFGRGPDGQLLLVVDSNFRGALPRMTTIDPVTLAVAPFAQNSNTTALALSAGTWSTALGKAVVLDSGSDVLRAFALGEVGAGAVIQPSSPISSPFSSSEVATLMEVPLDASHTLAGTFCSAKTTSGGCVPQVGTSGTPSASAGSGFTVQAQQVEPQNLGIFFYGQSGPTAVPFQGGLLCVQPPTLRTPPQGSGGAAACGGAYALDFNAYVAGGADPSLQAGSVVHGQFWFRDPPEPQSGTGLSDGVTFTLVP